MSNIRIEYDCSTSTIDILMSMALAFDALLAVKQLQKAGIAEPQSEAIVNIVSDINEEFATKSDLEKLKEATEVEFKIPRQETKADIDFLLTWLRLPLIELQGVPRRLHAGTNG